ncbi:sugar ABC transporter substrate-binding protein [Salsipaludibacter albus]|uniref:sugar ABC transporter substrate-binding protein n=1 Tax=Salsipaludibacter albus TaxID=2849650 RepID=UPI001EE42524|nr:sugar ABC transporter substrate-binding protein [Salsipaludibacter albus]MBY5164164.1 sugar ABC transporter substrate-binding protein [Salsipaludibacter albus]
MPRPTTRRVLATTTIALALVATGCGGGDSGPTGAGGEPGASDDAATDAGGDGGGGDTLTVWAMGAEGEKLPDFVADFEEAEGVTVEVTPIPWDVAHDKLITAAAGQQAPDVTQMGTTWMGEFAELGALAPTPDTVDESRFFEGPWSTTQVDGTSYGVPWYVDTRVMYYRTDLAEEAGYTEAPATWEELSDLAAKMQSEAGAKYGINLSPANWQEMMPFSWEAGAELTDDEGNLTLDTPGMVEGMTYYDSFFEDGVAAEPVTDFAVEQGFVDGTHPIFFSGPWHVGLIDELGGEEFADKWAVAPMPEKENRNSFVGGADLVVFEDSPNQELAWKFVDWMTQTETQQAWYETVAGLPSVTEAWESGDLADDERLSVFGTQLEETVAPPSIPEWEEVATAINGLMEQVTVGDVAPEDAVTQMQAEADSIVG